MEAGAEAEAQYFKKIVNFAKDAIHTIAPAISTKNKKVCGLAKEKKSDKTMFPGYKNDKSDQKLKDKLREVS